MDKPKNVIIPDEFERIHKQFMYLASIPEVEQKSKEWHEMRHNLITASSCASALGENPYKKRLNFLIEKCMPEPPYEPSISTHHGNKYEDIATMIYEEIYNVDVKLFGLIGHPTIDFIGASPDGICSSTRKSDKLFSDKYGTMLEIKCPYRRKIKKKGKIDGDICPHYYWVQVQVQLECCDLDKCDFWQCTIREYDSKEEWISDELKVDGVSNQNLVKGAIIQLLPKNKPNVCIYDAKYIYPPSLNMTVSQYEEWINSVEPCQDYYFDRTLFWRLEDCYNQEILRDKEWFQKALPKFSEFWNEVMYFRENPSKLKEVQRKYHSFDASL